MSVRLYIRTRKSHLFLVMKVKWSKAVLGGHDGCPTDVVRRKEGHQNSLVNKHPL